MHEMPASCFLPSHTVKQIDSGDLKSLSDVYQNLQADRDKQRTAITKHFSVLLTPWELLCFNLFKAITDDETSGHDEFYLESYVIPQLIQRDERLTSLRLDKQRMLVIVAV
jgi:hypothetical protein